MYLRTFGCLIVFNLTCATWAALTYMWTNTLCVTWCLSWSVIDTPASWYHDLMCLYQCMEINSLVCESGSVHSTSFSGLFEISHDSTATAVPSDCNRKMTPCSEFPLGLYLSPKHTYYHAIRNSSTLPSCSPYSSSIAMWVEWTALRCRGSPLIHWRRQR